MRYLEIEIIRRQCVEGKGAPERNNAERQGDPSSFLSEELRSSPISMPQTACCVPQGEKNRSQKKSPEQASEAASTHPEGSGLD
jgi:hypothetical protein